MFFRFVFFSFVLSMLQAAFGENWPQWRGPFFNGSSTETNLPSQWSKTEHVTWVVAMPGQSAATPSIWEDSVFVSSPDAEGRLLLLCLDRKTGQVRWQHAVSKGNFDRGRNNTASPSPVTDGSRVIVLYATGDLAASDFSGKELWRRELAAEYGRFANMWVYGSSPLLYGGKLYVQAVQRADVPYGHAQDGKSERESFLLCLDPATGKNLWRQVRSSDAHEESQEAYTTPIPSGNSGVAEILIVGADYITAHNPDTGAEVWRCGGLNDRNQRSWRIVPSPVTAEGLVFACAPKRDPVLAIKDGGHGLVTATNIAWRFKEFPSDCVTPLVYRKKLFVLDGDRQMLTCLEPRSGEKLWQGNLGVREIFRASPTGADDKIYCVSEEGTVVVLDAGQEFKVASTFAVGEAPVRSSIAVAQGKLFLRTAKSLYCVGN